MTEKTGYFTAFCPRCKYTFNQPYWKEVKVMTAEEIDDEFAEACVRLLGDRVGYFFEKVRKGGK